MPELSADSLGLSEGGKLQDLGIIQLAYGLGCYGRFHKLGILFGVSLKCECKLLFVGVHNSVPCLRTPIWVVVKIMVPFWVP